MVFMGHIFLFNHGLRPCLSEFLGDCQEIVYTGNPPPFPSSEKVGKKDAPVKSRFPRRSARLRETLKLAPLRHAAFLLPQTLARSGLFNGESLTLPPPTLSSLMG